MRTFTNSTTPAVSLSSFDVALRKYALANKTRRSASGVRLGQARYASDSHVVVTHAMLDGVLMRVETSRKWGVVTTPCKSGGIV
jgi:hypothetical protein